jgi:hypothetical protein
MILELCQDLLSHLLLNATANNKLDQTQCRYRMVYGITDFLSAGSRIQRGDDIVHERNVKLSGEIQ